MFRFEDPIYLWLLLVVPVLVLIRFLGWRRRKKQFRLLGDTELLKSLMPDVSEFRPIVKFSLLLAGLSLLICMLARPQLGSKVSHESRNGIEIVIALDKSKLLVENLVDNFTNDKVGLVVFAGDAFVQLPITSDYVSAKMFLQNIDPSLISTQGTDIARAIRLSMKSFTQQEKVGRAIIVITDGEDHEGGAVEAAQEAKKKGFNIFILGVGDPKGSPIPTGSGGYMKDETGNTVMSALNEQMCQEVAKAGNGTYIHVDNTSDAQEKLDDQLVKLQKGDMGSLIYSEYDEQFQAVGVLAILLLILEIMVLESRNPLLKNLKLFKKK